MNEKTGVEALEWTDLVGYHKRALVTDLPAHMDQFLSGASLVATRKVWTELAAMMKVTAMPMVKLLRFLQIISNEKNSSDDIDNYEGHAGAFLDAFVNHTTEGGGYGRLNVTPYIHILCCHFPDMMRSLQDGGAIIYFTGT